MKLLLAVFLLAETWNGYLVDAGCFASQERNVNPFDGNFNTNHDRGYEVRVCRPSATTRSFTLVGSDGAVFELDSAGNQKAAELVRQTGRQQVFSVTVTGEKHKDTVTLDSISVTR